jgi:hypothetical protein
MVRIFARNSLLIEEPALWARWPYSYKCQKMSKRTLFIENFVKSWYNLWEKYLKTELSGRLCVPLVKKPGI